MRYLPVRAGQWWLTLVAAVLCALSVSVGAQSGTKPELGGEPGSVEVPLLGSGLGRSGEATSLPGGAQSSGLAQGVESGMGAATGKSPGAGVKPPSKPSTRPGEAATEGSAEKKVPDAGAGRGGRAELGETDFQRFVQQSTGRALGLFGFDLFARGGFTASQGSSVPSSYVLGPGDEVVVQAYGLIDLTERLVIDREGRVLLPKAGPLTLAGVPFGHAEKVIGAHLGKIYRNFKLTVTMGRLRSAELFVVGQARNPGKHVVSGLSTLINALFETGGPNANGSLRAVELRRGGKAVARVDVYQFLAKGDDSGDVKLQPGDVIYIPPAGPRAAILGTVNVPAIYELKPSDTLHTILDLTGGLPVLAAPQRAQLERINPSREVARYVENFALDAPGLARKLQAGDVLTVFPISPEIADVVTLQGNVATPMRYAFRKGMKVSDLVTGNNFLVPVKYWLSVNAGDNIDGLDRPEVNLHYATVQRLDLKRLRTVVVPFHLAKALRGDAAENLALEPGDVVRVYGATEPGPEAFESVALNAQFIGGTKRFAWRAGTTVRDLIPDAAWLQDEVLRWARAAGLTQPGGNLKHQINLDYAAVRRVDPAGLRSELLSFNLGKALAGDTAENLTLKPGDQISLFTSTEFQVPVEQRIRLVTVSGEVKVPGVYQVVPGETLAKIVQRAGGFTADAYGYGTEFNRESTRVMQQQALDRIVQRIETQLMSNVQTKLQNINSTDQAQTVQTSLQADQLRLANLRKLKATGRVALSLDPDRVELPPVPLEDGDLIHVPSRPAFVGVFGAVRNENALLWKPGISVRDVIDQAGTDLLADVSETYVLRADGTVIGGGQVTGFLGWGGIHSVKLLPGDTVLVPERADRETLYSAFIRGAKDITAIFYQFGLGAAAVKTLRN